MCHQCLHSSVSNGAVDADVKQALKDEFDISGEKEGMTLEGLFCYFVQTLL